MKFVNFGSYEDKRCVHDMQIRIAADMEFDNEFEDEVYLCMIDPHFVAGKLKDGTVVEGSRMVCLFSEVAFRNEPSREGKRWHAMYVDEWMACKRQMDGLEMVFNGEFGLEYDEVGKQKLLEEIKACYGARTRKQIEMRRAELAERKQRQQLGIER